MTDAVVPPGSGAGLTGTAARPVLDDHAPSTERPLATGGREARAALASCFERSADDIGTRLDEFPKYVRRQRIARLLALYEVFKEALPVKGSVVNCGVFRGFSLAAFAHFSSILEPANMRRHVYGFDTFQGFADVATEDRRGVRVPRAGDLAADPRAELEALTRIHDRNRYLGNRPKVTLIAGDARETIPAFLRDNGHVLVSLLFLDFDLYEPTRVAIQQLVPRMPKGAILAFDELDHPVWPGETLALLETIGVRRLALLRSPFDPHVAYAKLD